ncbi:hypothetical protein PHLGIDRAFT_113814 [Phlebiopsis gigantea 11061_1 CR5-6]|uniref:Uncharacterized protein n=1 Tax=Phlebiopsis gigantea (strain 11061_1 CR5-6) TaxID=745531 RepID=A0A0C3P361_PHLG1|nr:hypothetical protein PHLGIDRAFT_113814 [Phlebiopsis gigantea 11061_1 CR5-6]
MGHRPLADFVSENLTLLYEIYLEHYPKRIIRWLLSYLRDLQYSDIALDSRFHFAAYRLHGILGRKLALELYVLIALCFALLGLLYSIYCCRRGGVREHPDSPRLHAPLHALLSFLTPVTSIWPEEYLRIAQSSLSHSSSRLRVPLRTLLRDVLRGTVELRYPSADLPSFILNTHTSLGWSITPSIGIRPLKPRSPALPDFSRTPFPEAASDYKSKLNANPQAPAMALSLSSGMTMLVLDAVPYSCLPAYIRSFQRGLPSGSSAMLGFSTYGNRPSFIRGSFVYAAIPFLARQHVTKQAASRSGSSSYARCPSLDIQPTPLMTTLNGVLNLLTSGSSPLVVESVQNVSEQYASYLDRYARELTDLPKVRDKFVAQWGIAGWREERLMVTWEAALFRAGLMLRWVVLVTHNEYA